MSTTRHFKASGPFFQRTGLPETAILCQEPKRERYAAPIHGRSRRAEVPGRGAGSGGPSLFHPHRARRAIIRGDSVRHHGSRSSLRGRARCDGGIRRRSRRGPRCAGSGRCSPPRMSGMLSSPPRRGGGSLRESGAVHMSWATPVLSAVFPAVDYRFAFPSLPDHGGVTRERDKESALMDIMTRGCPSCHDGGVTWRGCPTGQHETRVVLPVTICHDS